MDEFTVQIVAWAAGMLLGSYMMAKILAFKTRKKRHAREQALNDIVNHKWDTGEHNDAVVITRIAMKGLAGE